MTDNVLSGHTRFLRIPWEFPGGPLVRVPLQGGMGSIPGWGTKILHDTQHRKKKKIHIISRIRNSRILIIFTHTIQPKKI